MRLFVEHVTVYRYDQPVRGVVQSHRLHPTTSDNQRILSWNVEVSGGIKGGHFRDGAGDLIQSWSVAGPVEEITVTLQGQVETTDTAGVLRGHRETAPPMVWLRETDATAADAGLTDLAHSVQGETALGLAHALAAAVSEAIEYVPGTTDATTSAAEALALGKGVCQDQAHALIACARLRDLPARYVSGYLYSDSSDDQPQAAHAWAEIWIEGLGWIGFDPANRCCPDDRYIRLGAGFDAQDAAPIRGIARGPGTETMHVSLNVKQGQMQSQSQQ